MATPSITQAEFKAIVNGNVHSKFGQCSDTIVVMNRGVRFVLGDLDLRSLKRYGALSPNLFDDIYEYAAPSDLKGEKVIDIRKQTNRTQADRFLLVDDAAFDRTKGLSPYRIAIRDENFGKILRIDGVEGDTRVVLHNCDSKTANGTWAATADASNITADSDDFIDGSASLNFDTATGAGTAVLTNAGMTAVDLSTWDQQGSVFMWVFIPDSFTLASITNFILKWGTNSANYWSKTVTTTNDGLGFKAGWNLLRFDWSTATQTGTVTPASIGYLQFTLTKSGAQAADTDWRIDEIIFRKGAIYETVYYSKFGWQTSAGAYIEESTTTTDLLVADTDEIEMMGFKTAEFAAQELKEYEDVTYNRAEYDKAKMRYLENNPSEALKKRRQIGTLRSFRQ